MLEQYYDANHCDSEVWFRCEKCGATSPTADSINAAQWASKQAGWYTLAVKDFFGEVKEWLHYCGNHWKEFFRKLNYERKKQRHYDELRRNNLVAWEQRRAEQCDRKRRNVPIGKRFDVLRRDGFKCKLCGRSEADGVKLHVDHIVPDSRGGSIDMSNLQTLCHECNIGKSNKL